MVIASFARSLCGALVALCCILLLTACSATPARSTPEVVDLTSELGDLDATFVLRDCSTGATRLDRPDRAATGFIPASTFKIPNSMIALETGVADGSEFAMAWDRQRDPPSDGWAEAWKADHTLRTAFRHSVVWYYRELARRIGAERMGEWLVRLDYGNRSTEGGLDRFWLDGAIRISALEQVDFLERFVGGRLPLRLSTVEAMRSIMVIEETPGYRLSGKTGTAVPEVGLQIGWLVGFVERPDGRTHVFAFNMSHPRVWQEYPRERRVEMVKQILRRLGVIGPA